MLNGFLNSIAVCAGVTGGKREDTSNRLLTWILGDKDFDHDFWVVSWGGLEVCVSGRGVVVLRMRPMGMETGAVEDWPGVGIQSS